MSIEIKTRKFEPGQKIETTPEYRMYMTLLNQMSLKAGFIPHIPFYHYGFVISEDNGQTTFFSMTQRGKTTTIKNEFLMPYKEDRDNYNEWEKTNTTVDDILNRM